jgi:hypothetical protein
MIAAAVFLNSKMRAGSARNILSMPPPKEEMWVPCSLTADFSFPANLRRRRMETSTASRLLGRLFHADAGLRDINLIFQRLLAKPAG